MHTIQLLCHTCHVQTTALVRPHFPSVLQQAGLPVDLRPGLCLEAAALGAPHPSCTAPSCLPERPRVLSGPPGPTPRRAASTTRELACVGRKGSASLQTFPGIPESTCKSHHHTLFPGTVHGRLNKKGKFKRARRNDFFQGTQSLLGFAF